MLILPFCVCKTGMLCLAAIVYFLENLILWNQMWKTHSFLKNALLYKKSQGHTHFLNRRTFLLERWHDENFMRIE